MFIAKLDPSSQGTGMTRRGHCRHKGTSVSYLDDKKRRLLG
ncbi:MAG: hypothetical protein O7167_05565 [Wolbachia endosymbiont of Andrena nigroaenea]|nr:hypothetical protein [Wolbachia endosymbiont (group A) of Andrena hattorfiana]MDX5527307.1 hypothetical protein [Wolbachia endosymbiont of Andrena nigroaenea]